MRRGRGLVARLLQVLDEATPSALAEAEDWIEASLIGPDLDRLRALLATLRGPRAVAVAIAEDEVDARLPEVEVDVVHAEAGDGPPAAPAPAPDDPELAADALFAERDEFTSILGDDERMNRQTLIDALRQALGHDAVPAGDTRGRRELVAWAADRFCALPGDARRRLLRHLRKRYPRARAGTLDEWAR